MPRESFKSFVEDFPNQIGVGIELVDKIRLKPAAYNQVLACGMGGSSLGASLVNTYLDLKPDLKVHRSYGLPNDVTSKTLIIALSYSGNTKETLSAAYQALEQKNSLVVVTSGGRLLELAQKHDLPVVIMPTGMPPRLSVGLQFSIIVSVLARTGIINPDPEALIEATAQIAQDNQIELSAQIIAEKVGERIPLIYTSSRLGSLARIWKVHFNETAKSAAFWHTLPEANHNEITSFSDRGDLFHLITLRDKKDDPRIIKRFDLTEQHARKNGLTVSSGELLGETHLSRLLHTAWLGSWVAFSLAKNKNVDPLDIGAIEQFKKSLS